ncbi:MAG TPA: choice-of-anchor tandem repeat GloVer-containing protein [Terriglobia bacterium]|nr:choice-of-anchor tandem repeat GloVer-containing protein [Terriglobia bacterium]
MTRTRRSGALTLGLLLTIAAPLAQAYTYKELHNFAGSPTDGAHPFGSLIRDSAGNLYGTTAGGGAWGSGAVFTVAATGAETVLYSFTGKADGSGPVGGLVRDAEGNLYGATAAGGASNYGAVFKLDTTGTEAVLYSFTGGADGANPDAGLVGDAEGNLYGTTEGGGASGAGVVFKVGANGTEAVLYAFTGGVDGGRPEAGLLRDSRGNLRGTASSGGPSEAGVVFKLDPQGTETVLYAFTGGADGGGPEAALIRDQEGNLYGTTVSGGLGYGVVFKLDTSGTEAALYTFKGGTDGANPYAGLVRDSAGNLYGTTYGGGRHFGSNGFGVAFEVDTAGTETVLHTFAGKAAGAHPRAALIRDSKGHLYSATGFGGTSGNGVVFRLTP